MTTTTLEINSQTIHIYCIDGCHGAGKSTMLREFTKQTRKEVMPEGFLNATEMDPSSSPQSYDNELLWVKIWFKQIHNRITECIQYNQTSIVCDRSPYAACAYVLAFSKSLQRKVDLHLEKLCKFEFPSHEIHFHIWILNPPRQVIWRNIKHRLIKEPFRRNFNEHIPLHMDKVIEYFLMMEKEWRTRFHSKFMEFKYFDNSKSLLHELTRNNSQSLKVYF